MSTGTEELNPPGVVQWSAERFYWVILDRRDALTASPSSAALQELVQDDLPCPASDLALIAIAVSCDHLVVCGIPRQSLTDLPAHIVHCGPAALPEWIEASYPSAFPELREINFLVGPFTPPLVRKRQRQRAFWSSGLILTAAMLIMIGLSRRASHAESLADRHSQQLESLAPATIGVSATASQADTLLQERLERSETIRRGESQPLVDVGIVTAQLLSKWPADLTDTPRVEILTASRDQLSLSITTPGDPQELLGRLTSPPGWKLLEPRLSTRGTGTQIQLEFRPQKGGAS
jgi:hypothetical protein